MFNGQAISTSITGLLIYLPVYYLRTKRYLLMSYSKSLDYCSRSARLSNRAPYSAGWANYRLNSLWFSESVVW